MQRTVRAGRCAGPSPAAFWLEHRINCKEEAEAVLNLSAASHSIYSVDLLGVLGKRADIREILATAKVEAYVCTYAAA
jgi:hypothetical protein